MPDWKTVHTAVERFDPDISFSRGLDANGPIDPVDPKDVQRGDCVFSSGKWIGIVDEAPPGPEPVLVMVKGTFVVGETP